MKTGFFAVLMLFLTVSCHQNETYTLKGKFTGTPDEEWIYMIRLFDDISTMDSAKIINGEFTFQGEVERPEVYALHYHIERIIGVATVFLEPGVILLNIDLENWDLNSKATGTPLNDAFNTFEAGRIEQFYKDIWALEDQKMQAGAEDIEVINQGIEALQNASLQHELDYIQKHPDSPLALFLFSRIQFNLSPKAMHKIIQSFDPSLRQTLMYQTIVEEYENLKLTGEDDGLSEWSEPLELQ
jgi:hypothetical protein